MDRKIRNLKLDEEKKHLEMLNSCFAPWGNEEKWGKKYRQPKFDITKNVFVVEENGEWVGGVSIWFYEAFLKENRKTRVFVAGDGYVHPNHRGKGVYSTFMRHVNSYGRRMGASLGFGFISIYEVPFSALPRYGFADIFYPINRVLILNPGKFLKYVFKRAKEANLPDKFEGMNLRINISLKSLKGKFTLSNIFQVNKRKLHELKRVPIGTGDKEKIDLEISTDIETLFKIFRYFHLKRKTMYPFLLVNMLKGRLKFRFSVNLLKKILRF